MPQSVKALDSFLAQCGIPVKGLSEFLIHSRSFIAGSSILYTVLKALEESQGSAPVSWIPNDIDIWIPYQSCTNPMNNLLVFINEKTHFIMNDTLRSNDLDPKQLDESKRSVVKVSAGSIKSDESDESNESNDSNSNKSSKFSMYSRFNNWIEKTSTFTSLTCPTKLQLIFLKKSRFNAITRKQEPIDVSSIIQNFDLELCKFWWSGCGPIQSCHSFVPTHVELNPNMESWNARDMERTFSRAIKYHQRGFPWLYKRDVNFFLLRYKACPTLKIVLKDLFRSAFPEDQEIQHMIDGWTCGKDYSEMQSDKGNENEMDMEEIEEQTCKCEDQVKEINKNGVESIHSIDLADSDVENATVDVPMENLHISQQNKQVNTSAR